MIYKKRYGKKNNEKILFQHLITSKLIVKHARLKILFFIFYYC